MEINVETDLSSENISVGINSEIDKKPDTSIDATIVQLEHEINEIHQAILQTADTESPEGKEFNKTADLIKSEAHIVAEQLKHLPRELTLAEEEQIRQENRAVYETLGITTAAERAVEAALFIDSPFMEIAQLRGDEHPEELFGVRAWKGWIEARAAAKNITGDISTDEIKNLHIMIAQGLSEIVPGKIRNDAYIASSDLNPGKPVTFTQIQIEAIQNHPLLKIDFTNKRKKQGYILYPTTEDLKLLDKCKATLPPDAQKTITTDETLVMALLENFVQDFNGSLPSDTTEAIARAADLQRQFVAIHPFEDANGRLSRLLMNLYLERVGLEPAILEHAEDDLYYSKEDWEGEVADGIDRYQVLKGKSEQADITQREAILGGDYIEFFEQIHQSKYPLPPKDGLLNHSEYRKYIQNLEDAFTEFQRFTSAITRLSAIVPDWDWDLNDIDRVEMGGLIPQSYIKVWGNTRPEVQNYVREQFYYPVEVFRGDVIDGLKSSDDLLRFFKKPTTFGAAYRSLTRKNLFSSDIRSLSVSEIRQVLNEYNQLVIADFSHRILPEMPRDSAQIEESELHLWDLVDDEPDDKTQALYALSAGKYLGYLLHYHQQGDNKTWASPAVSTSADKTTGEVWAEKLEKLHDAPEGRKGILVTSLLPKHGIYYTPDAGNIPIIEDTIFTPSFQGEQEFLLMGGLDPNAITAIKMTNKDGYVESEAKRDGNNIILTDYDRKVEERYAFDKYGVLKFESKQVIEDMQLPEDEEPVSSSEEDEASNEDNYEEEA